MFKQGQGSATARRLLFPSEQVETLIGIAFRDRDFLVRSFIHRSYLNEAYAHDIQSYERQEFLGDAVLELIVTHYIFRTFPNKPEGEMTNIRSALVNGYILSEVAEDIGISRFVVLSKGEEKEFKQKRSGYKYILACVIEALIGGIFLDRGLGAAEIFVLEYLIPKAEKAVKDITYNDPKSVLQELVQAELNIMPHYELLNEYGPDHNKRFVIGCFFNEQQITSAEGRSKSEAEAVAARQILVQHFGIALMKAKA